jgi:hypothetical protein
MAAAQFAIYPSYVCGASFWRIGRSNTTPVGIMFDPSHCWVSHRRTARGLGSDRSLGNGNRYLRRTQSITTHESASISGVEWSPLSRLQWVQIW